jgi:hypothetical protein
MDALNRPFDLNADTAQVLDQLRTSGENPLYGAAPDTAEAQFQRLVMPLLEGAGLTSLLKMHYSWFLREAARLWRTRRGRDLAFNLEMCIRKWAGLGLEPNTLQFLVCELADRLKTAALALDRVDGDCP